MDSSMITLSAGMNGILAAISTRKGAFTAHYTCPHCGARNDPPVQISIGVPSQSIQDKAAETSSSLEDAAAESLKETLNEMHDAKLVEKYGLYSFLSVDGGVPANKTIAELTPFICLKCGAGQIPQAYRRKKRLGWRFGLLAVFLGWLAAIVALFIVLVSSTEPVVYYALAGMAFATILMPFIWVPIERIRTKKANADPEKLFRYYHAAYNDHIILDGQVCGIPPFEIGEIRSDTDATAKTPQFSEPVLEKKPQAYTERDNLGTRQETMNQANVYWLVERMGQSVKPPFTLFVLPSAESARAALLELPFIHEASDSGKLVCDRLMTFGYYAITENNVPTGQYEALVCGSDLTLAEFELAESLFTRYGGTRKSAEAPDASVKAPGQAGNANAVKYKEKLVMNGSVYETYVAPDKASALAFLKGKTVTQNMYYISVDTPEGCFGKDINGIYQAS